MSLALYGPNVSDDKKWLLWGVGVTLNQSCCYGYQSSDVNLFLNLFSIKHYLKQFEAKYGASIANSKFMSV